MVRTGLQMIGGNHLLQLEHIVLLAQSRMSNQFVIPDAVQIARMGSALSGAKSRNGKVAASMRVRNGMERLDPPSRILDGRLGGDATSLFCYWCRRTRWHAKSVLRANCLRV